MINAVTGKRAEKSVSPVSGSRKAEDDRDWKCQPKSWKLLISWCMMCKSPRKWPGSYHKLENSTKGSGFDSSQTNKGALTKSQGHNHPDDPSATL